MTFSLKITTAEEKAENAREALRVAASTVRDDAIGVGAEVGGKRFHTDDVSQLRISGAVLAVVLDPSYTVEWKTVDGSFIHLDAAQIIGVAQAIQVHVQACFNAEAAVLAQIDALDAGDVATFDVAAAYAAAKGG